MKDKARLRQEMLGLRKALPQNEAERLSMQAQRRLLAETMWARASSVALYVAVRRETQTWLLLDDAWRNARKVYLPRVADAPGLMRFALCSGPDKMAPGAFGISEPNAACQACVFAGCGGTDAESQLPVVPLPDIFVIPGLAFDRRGHRMGWGGGYYDRYLGGLAARSGPGPKIVALAYAFQLLDSIPFDSWDKPVDAVCTDKEFLWTS